MNFIIFAIAFPLIILLSLLPMRLLYVLSDFFFFLIYYVVGYRKKVVEENIKIAFPDKSEGEIKLMAKKFFRHFVDLIFESIKSFTISSKELKRRYKYKNIEVINDLSKAGRSIVLTGVHHNNWEYSFGLPLFTDINCVATYTKISNIYFELFIGLSRIRFGFDGTATHRFKNFVERRYKSNIQSLYVLISDQSPRVERTKYWGNFFGQFVPVHTGAELLAKQYNLAIVNMSVMKVRRGFYEVEFQLISDDPNSYDNYELTDKYLKITENNIKKQPENYLWSHRRFKHVGKYEEWKTVVGAKKESSDTIPQSV